LAAGNGEWRIQRGGFITHLSESGQLGRARGLNPEKPGKEGAFLAYIFASGVFIRLIAYSFLSPHVGELNLPDVLYYGRG
jgi:hypothetical protein